MTTSHSSSDDVHDNPTGWIARHIRRYVESNGEEGHRFYGHDALLLTTRGRRSGKLRRTALYYGEDDGRYVLVASDGGKPNDPAWYLNVTADPEVEVQIRAEKFAARARPATASERPRLWALMTAIFPKYLEYQGKASRQIPILVVERAA
jgi:deazaflavin-dependent oxidoreductase (nitroreductase family)